MNQAIATNHEEAFKVQLRAAAPRFFDGKSGRGATGRVFTCTLDYDQ